MFRRRSNELASDSQLQACLANVGSLSAAKEAAEGIAGTTKLAGLEVVEIIEIANGAATRASCSARLVLSAQGIYEPVCPRDKGSCSYQKFTESSKT